MKEIRESLTRMEVPVAAISLLSYSSQKASEILDGLPPDVARNIRLVYKKLKQTKI